MLSTQPPACSLRIGLTGGIGSGKTTVGQILASLGAHVIDTDAISRALTQPHGAAIGLIRSQFGPQYIDQSGALDRAQMRALVFRDSAAKQRLEALLHPLIYQVTQQQANMAQPGQSLVFDIPLLTEKSSFWRPQLDRILVIDCSQESQIKRVIARSGWSHEMVEQVICQQASRAARQALADDLILNDGLSLEQLTYQVTQLWHNWQVNLFNRK